MKMNNGLLKQIWEKLTEMPMHKAVRILAPKYFAEFGFQEVHKDHKDIESVIALTHCEVHFYHWKWDLGSYIKPLMPKLILCNVAETSIPYNFSGKKAWHEVDRQMKLIIEKYRPALEGDFSSWPNE